MNCTKCVLLLGITVSLASTAVAQDYFAPSPLSGSSSSLAIVQPASASWESPAVPATPAASTSSSEVKSVVEGTAFANPDCGCPTGSCASGGCSWHDRCVSYLCGCRDGICDFCHDCGEDIGCYCHEHCIYGYAEALFLSRVTNTNGQPVFILTENPNNPNITPGPTVLSTNGIAASDFNPGVRLMVGWQHCCDEALEFEYWGLWDLNNSKRVTSDNLLRFPGDLGLASLDFFGGNVGEVAYHTQLNNFEVNVYHDICDCCGCRTDWQWLLGFRYINLEDQLNIVGMDPDTGHSVYHIATQNNLFGPQIGARIVRHCGCGPWGWDATGRIGIFGNAAEQTQFVTDFPAGGGTPDILRGRRTDRAGEVAMVADMNVSAIYKLNCTWAIRAGYNVMWIENVATAPDQLDFTDTAQSGSIVQTKGGEFFHGVNIGLEANW